MDSFEVFITAGVLYSLSMLICDHYPRPAIRAALCKQALPDNAIRACCVLVILVAPVSLLLTGIYWVGWWLFHLGVALAHFAPRRLVRIPRARVLRAKE